MTTVLLDAADLPAALAAAQAGLAAAAAGSAHVWRLPPTAPGVVLETGPLELGLAGRSLTLAADPAPAAPVLRVVAGGAAAGLVLVGTDVTLRGVEVRVEGDDVVGVALRASGRATLSASRVVVTGRTVTAVEVTAAAAAEVVDVQTPGVRATAGDATGVAVTAPVGRLHRVTVTGLTASGAAVGVRAEAPSPGGAASGGAGGAGGAVTVTRLRVDAVVGAVATGVDVRAGSISTPDPEAAGTATDAATVLDVDVRDVRARAADGVAVGLAAAVAGPLDVRGVSATRVSGATAAGLDLLVGGPLVLSGATVRSVTGAAGGATGARVRAAAAPGALEVDDVHVEAVVAPDHADLVRGLEVTAPVSELAPWVDADTDPGPVRLTGCVLHRVSGTALAMDADLRDVEVRGVETFAAARAATVRGERVTVSESTWHRLQHGITVGPCSLTVVNTLLTRVVDGPVLTLDAETEVVAVTAAFGAPADPAPLVTGLPGGDLPYLDAGPAGVPASLALGRPVPEVAVDLRLTPGSGLHDLAVRTPGDPPDRPRHVGARPPGAEATCDLRDPLAVPEPGPAPVPPPGPVIDRSAKDGRGLLGVMRARAAAVLPGWVPDDAADLTTTLLELVAHRLDRISYRQDAALTEAYLPTARLRRSVEEHARLVDHRPDPGLSATTMLEVRIDDPAALGLTTPAGPGVLPFVVAAGTVVVNPDAGEDPVVVSTEEDLVWHPSLASLTLADDVPAGAVHAVVRGDLLELHRDRWLVLAPDDPRALPHVVRATVVELGTDQTLVRWDPRRPSPRRYAADATRLLADVVPAHHGLHVSPGWAPAVADPDLAAQVEALAPELDLVLDGTRPTAEVPLPLAAASRVAAGWPFPGDPPRLGVPDVTVDVDGEPWRLVDDVATEPGEVFALAADAEGGTTVVLGQPGALPARPVQVRIGARLGRGTAGNVGAHTLTSLVALGAGSGPLPEDLDLERLRAALVVDNPVAGVGGRDPEPLDRIRRRAPWVARTPVTAVTADDHARLLEELPEVAAARARVVELGERRLVRTTLLLRDEDTLVTPGTPRDGSGGPAGQLVDLDLVRDAERIRRWAVARQRLEEVRLLGVDVQLVPPVFVPLDLDVVVDVEPWAPAERVHREVRAALESDGGLFDPDTVGLGGDVHVDAVLRRALGVDGVTAAQVRRLRRAVAGAGEHAVDGTLPVGDEEVAVLRRPYGDGPDGLLTVEVCGGLR
ncbi:hypothetical protein [uncultured Cellulomonas sp.]|uniref:hypothetical protein n=1 Tax=uncultured Cellulomonas sp. TaxID=189682 RepID=UPI002619CAB8|nr:hypothetical protein [uncultured Cellulomonas sp.]